ncbi:hypothetical protein V1507DRAFT_468913 [Lipomyces tetrasporus]
MINETVRQVNAYKGHMLNFHSGRYPTQCRYPDCDDTRQFNGTSHYLRHLQRAHGLQTKAERVPYYPDRSRRGQPRKSK